MSDGEIPYRRPSTLQEVDAAYINNAHVIHHYEDADREAEVSNNEPQKSIVGLMNKDVGKQEAQYSEKRANESRCRRRFR